MSDRALRIPQAIAIIEKYGGIDSGHHKQWVIDQVLRILLGSPETYDAWIQSYRSGEDGPNTYDWDEGVAP
jgi:hypothetical protein